MSKKYNKAIFAIIIIVFIIISLLALYKLYSHENNQKSQIESLNAKVDLLEEKLNQSLEYYEYDTEYKEDAYNYFAIGNSLTLIKSWGHGICSSQENNDYFNLVVSELRKKHGEVVAYPYNFAFWERAEDRSDALDLLNPFLDEKLNLVTIQLGENASDISTFQRDLEDLVDYIKSKAPNAAIIILGDWWSFGKNELRKNAAESQMVSFADFSDIIGNSEYQSYEGAICYASDGTAKEVSKDACTHPGDKGMQEIAQRVLAQLDIA